jgi:hypothetical protein
MSHCNCSACNPCSPHNNCIPECICTSPNYDNLGCIENKTECIVYNGNTLANIAVVKNQNLNTVFININSIISTLQTKVGLVSYASNADAVAALGVGILYKSTTLIGGSPMILITV